MTRPCRGVRAAGAPGGGTSALVDQLRPVVTGHDGWFVARMFGQYRRDLESGGGSRGFRALGRLDQLAVLRASRTLGSETSLERLHAQVVDVLGTLTGATAVHLLLWDTDRQDWLLPTSAGAVPVGAGPETSVPTSVLRYVERTGQPLLVADATADDRFNRDPCLAGANGCALLAVPILIRGSLRAVLLLENRLLRGAFMADRLDAVTLIAGQLAVALDNARLYAQLRASRARVVAAGDDTRRRIERNLHDGIQQRLLALVLQATAAGELADDQADQMRTELIELRSGLLAALDELRETARGIHPSILSETGLRAALGALAGRCPVPVVLEFEVEGRLPEPVEVAGYYVVAEALTNAVKHAEASTIQIAVTAGEELSIAVRDDGRGGAELTRGTGLLGLKDRIEALGGRIALHSPAGAGTTLTIALPLDGAVRSGQLQTNRATPNQ